MLATRKLSRKIEQPRIYRPASVSLFFENGSSESIRIIANTEGIQALKSELELAEKSIRRNKSYFFGDPLWLKGSSRMVVVEPAYSRLQSVIADESEITDSTEAVGENDTAPRIFWLSVILVMLGLMVIGGITVFRWLF